MRVSFPRFDTQPGHFKINIVGGVEGKFLAQLAGPSR